jgi:DNA repair exonuclease SbcCD ATPase subunit
LCEAVPPSTSGLSGLTNECTYPFSATLPLFHQGGVNIYQEQQAMIERLKLETAAYQRQLSKLEVDLTQAQASEMQERARRVQAEEETARVRAQYEGLLEDTHREIKRMEADVKEVQGRQRDREEKKDHIINNLKAKVLTLKEELRQLKTIVSR